MKSGVVWICAGCIAALCATGLYGAPDAAKALAGSACGPVGNGLAFAGSLTGGDLTGSGVFDSGDYKRDDQYNRWSK